MTPEQAAYERKKERRAILEEVEKRGAMVDVRQREQSNDELRARFLVLRDAYASLADWIRERDEES